MNTQSSISPYSKHDHAELLKEINELRETLSQRDETINRLRHESS